MHALTAAVESHVTHLLVPAHRSRSHVNTVAVPCSPLPKRPASAAAATHGATTLRLRSRRCSGNRQRHCHQLRSCRDPLGGVRGSGQAAGVLTAARHLRVISGPCRLADKSLAQGGHHRIRQGLTALRPGSSTVDPSRLWHATGSASHRSRNGSVHKPAMPAQSASSCRLHSTTPTLLEQQGGATCLTARHQQRNRSRKSSCMALQLGPGAAAAVAPAMMRRCRRLLMAACAIKLQMVRLDGTWKRGGRQQQGVTP